MSASKALISTLHVGDSLKRGAKQIKSKGVRLLGTELVVDAFIFEDRLNHIEYNDQ